MKDLQRLIAPILGTLAFYIAIRFVNRIADNAKPQPEAGQKIKKPLKAIIVIYAIAVTIQLIDILYDIFFN